MPMTMFKNAKALRKRIPISTRKIKVMATFLGGVKPLKRCPRTQDKINPASFSHSTISADIFDKIAFVLLYNLLSNSNKTPGHE